MILATIAFHVVWTLATGRVVQEIGCTVWGD
jgi:hypothetical protein